MCWIKLFSVITTYLALLMGVYGIGYVAMVLLNRYG